MLLENSQTPVLESPQGPLRGLEHARVRDHVRNMLQKITAQSDGPEGSSGKRLKADCEQNAA